MNRPVEPSLVDCIACCSVIQCLDQNGLEDERLMEAADGMSLNLGNKKMNTNTLNIMFGLAAILGTST